MNDNLLYDTKKSLMDCARMLPVIEVKGKKTNKYEDYDITVLADRYCKATDEDDGTNRSIYLSALLLRFWYCIDKMYQKLSGTDFNRQDCYDRLYDCIEAACKYRAWQDPAKKTNAQACINQVIAGRGVPAMLYEANLQKNATLVCTLDETLDDESGTTRADLVGDNSETEKRRSNEKVSSMVQELIGQGKIIEAIIADNMSYKDVFKHEKTIVKKVDENGEEYKFTKETSEFWPFQLVKELNALDTDYYVYFYNTYSIAPEKLAAAKQALDKANNQKKYKFIDVARESMKNCVNVI